MTKKEGRRSKDDGANAKKKNSPWDPLPTSFEDGVSLIESLFGGDGDGSTFSAFIEAWESGEVMATDGGVIAGLTLPTVNALEEANGLWGNLYVGSDVVVTSVESRHNGGGDLFHVLSTGADDGKPLEAGSLQRLLSLSANGASVLSAAGTKAAAGPSSKKRQRGGGGSANAAGGPSVFIFNADLVQKPLSRFLRDLDAGWRGDGGSTATLVATECGVEGTHVLPAHSRAVDLLLLQLEGCSLLEFHTVDQEPGTPMHDFGSEPEPLMLLRYDPEGAHDLRPGSCAFVPAGTVFSLRTASPSAHAPRRRRDRQASGGTHNGGGGGGVALTLICSLAPQSSVEKAVGNALALAKGEVVGDEDARVYPHDLLGGVRGEGSALASTAVSLLRRSAELAEAAVGQMLLRRRYPTMQFNTGAYLRKRYDLDALLDAGGGIVRITDFLPNKVALRILKTLQTVTDEEWGLTAAKEDSSANSIAHAFLSAKRFPNSNAIFRAFLGLRPGRKATFSAAKYGAGHWIDPHDDRQYREVFGKRFSREVALVYYLNKDWNPDMGGMFVDMHDPDNHVRHAPEFNSAVAFRVPRWHAVEPVAPGPHERLSIFGWWLKEGTLYDLHKGDGVAYPDRKKQQQAYSAY